MDIILKALSPAVNDTTTVIMAIDCLGELVGRLAHRTFPEALRSDGQHLRVLVRTYSFVDCLKLAFDLVRENAKGNPAVLCRLLRALALAAGQAEAPHRRRALREQVALVMACAQASLPTDYEQAEVQAFYDELRPAWA